MLIPRMLRREQTLEFAKRFVDQWLRTRQLDNDKAPDPSSSRHGPRTRSCAPISGCSPRSSSTKS